jgi:hypothetical protein
MSTSHNGNDYERLKEELRRLKRRGAPWYFESALHQRLHGGRRSRPRRRPISILPVLAVACVTLCILGLAVYAVFIHTNLFAPGTRQGAPADSVTHAQPTDTLRGAPPVNSGRIVTPPRVPGRVSRPDTVRSDTSAAAAPSEVKPAGADTGVVPSDTSGRQVDTSSHGVDSTAPPGRGKEG